MGKRFVVVGGATVVAGLVLGASVVFGPPAFQPTSTDLPDDIDAPNLNTPTDNPGVAAIEIQQFDYTAFEVDSNGQLRGMRLRAQRTNLKRQGITQLIKPNAEIRLGPQRAITITADKADMEMEDNKPRRGQFTGNVVVTIAEAPLGTQLILDTTNPDHAQFIQQRIYMDEATDFSIEDDTINTAGPVHVTSAQVDFFGVGLRLAYNTQRERIEQLIIGEGRYLIINPDANAPGFNPTDTPSTRQNPLQPADQQTDQTSPLNPTPKQFYEATFQDNVLVRDGLESQLAGQTLTIDFSLGTDAIQVQPINPDTTGQLPPVLPTGQLAQANFPREGEAPAEPGATADTPPILAPALPAVVIPPKNLERTLLQHKPDRDIVVTWTGELSILPHATRPTKLTDDQDAHITLQGPNAYAQTTRNGERERLETNQLEYLISQEQTTAYAREDQPLRILSTALGGEITGTKLIVRQKQGTATILGPGQLTYTDKKENKTLNLTWQNRLDLELYTTSNTNQASAPNADADPSEATGTATNTDRSQTKILGVKTATFDGDVTAKHTDFDLAASTLTLAFAQPDQAKNIDNTPTAINAAGSVVVQARGDAEDETFDITSGRLSIDLKLDSDQQPYAAAIRAVDRVSVNRPGSQITCNRISVELNPPPQASKPPADAEAVIASLPADADSGRRDAAGTEPQQAKQEEDRFAQVRSILAVGEVRAQLDDDGRRIDLIADQLIADVEKDKLTLASDNTQQPAEVTDLTTGRKLTGQLIEMDDQAQQLDITGPGSLATVIADPNKPDAGIEDAFLAIDWTKAMAFNNVTGLANFDGNVRSESQRSIDASELTCDQLTMQFAPPVAKQASPENKQIEELAENDKQEDAKEIDDTADREIRSAIATGNVKFLASAWLIDQPNQISNRIRLEGPKLVITNQPEAQGKPAQETLLVDGQGRMVFEDYRSPDIEDGKSKASMTGRGATLFSWDKTMTFDALANTATLLGTVQMVHLPKDEQGNSGDAVQLDCNKLVADMIDNGGMSVWLSDNAPDAEIQSILATDNVRLLQQGTRSMRGDRLLYQGKENLVTLDADDNRDVTLEDLERDTTTRTNKITWDLTTDRIEIDQLRGGVAPLN